MKTIRAEIVAAFVDERNGGNLAGVVLDEPDLTEAQMQEVARQVALPETVFVRAVPDGFFTDFFTPTKRVPDCGHATVAAFGLLAERDRIVGEHTIKHTVNGPRAMRVGASGVFMQQLPPRYETVAEPRAVLASLGLEDAGVLAGAPTVARHDVGFLIVPLRDALTLSTLQPDLDRIAAISAQLDIIGYYVFAPGSEGVDATVRMFAPHFGIPEESATGMAAGLLSGYLYDRAGQKRESFTIEQGVYMATPSPSLIHSRPVVRDGAIAEVWVGGHARRQGERQLEV